MLVGTENYSINRHLLYIKGKFVRKILFFQGREIKILKNEENDT